MRIGLIMALGAAVLAACSLAACSVVPSQPPASAEVPPGFVFVRDTADLFPPGQRRQAEESLRSIAGRTNVFGVVVSAEAADDPPAIAEPVIEEIAELGGEALVAICTPDACDLTAATFYSASLADVVDRVAPAPESAPGQGRGTNPRNELRRWREFVGAVATIER